jgi:hypothetical protein
MLIEVEKRNNYHKGNWLDMPDFFVVVLGFFCWRSAVYQKLIVKR